MSVEVTAAVLGAGFGTVVVVVVVGVGSWLWLPGFCKLLFVCPGFVSCEGPGAGVFSVLWAKTAPAAIRTRAVASERMWRFIESSSQFTSCSKKETPNGPPSFQLVR